MLQRNNNYNTLTFFVTYRMYVLIQNVQSTVMCVRRCAQHWRKWAQNKKRQHCNVRSSERAINEVNTQWIPSERAINGVNTEWINLVKYVNIIACSTKCKHLLCKPDAHQPLSQLHLVLFICNVLYVGLCVCVFVCVHACVCVCVCMYVHLRMFM